MYDSFSLDYDRFVNWPNRLAVELPFIQQQLARINPAVDQPFSILDAACGTGMHVVALAQQGHTVSGADLSTGMIERAKENAAAAGVEAYFTSAGFGNLAQAFHSTLYYAWGIPCRTCSPGPSWRPPWPIFAPALNQVDCF
jgi:glycine/sarcosine N-methyltransferase